MAQKTAEISDKITVVVFKDNYAARTFQIPLRWISTFGFLIGVLAFLSTLCAIFIFRYYHLAFKTDPLRVHELEQEISELKTNRVVVESPQENRTETHSTTRPEVQPTKASTPGTSQSPLFSAFPPTTLESLPDPTTLPFAIQPPKWRWIQKTLRIQFALQYLKENTGTQQGRIIILARGPGALYSYPTEAIAAVGSSNLISPEEGEAFSVSRFREVKADFGPLPSRTAIQEIEILIFSKSGQALAYQKLSLSPPESAGTVNTPSTAAHTKEENTQEGNEGTNDP